MDNVWASSMRLERPAQFHSRRYSLLAVFYDNKQLDQTTKLGSICSYYYTVIKRKIVNIITTLREDEKSRDIKNTVATRRAKSKIRFTFTNRNILCVLFPAGLLSYFQKWNIRDTFESNRNVR